MTSETAARALVAGVMLLVGGGAGYAARGALQGRVAERAEPAASAELVGLRDGLERVERSLAELDSRLVATAPAALPATTRTALDPGLEQRLRELVERLERADVVGRRTSAPELVIPAGRPQPLPARARGEDFEERQRRYQLWTHQQVADAFGRPERVTEHDGKLVWQYRREVPDDGHEWLSFWFADGVVLGVYD